jgi:hypothetical protein
MEGITMSLSATGVINASLAAIATQDVQNQLSDPALLLNSVINLSSQVGPGMKSVAIPRISGMSATDIPDDGSDSTSAGMTIAVDTLSLSSKKEVADYVYDTAMDSAVDLEAAFFGAAPGVLIEKLENLIYLELDGASSSNPDHILAMSATSGTVMTMADVRLAAKLLDEQKLPQSDRYLIVNPTTKHQINAFTEVASNSVYGSDAGIHNRVESLYGFKILTSNQATAGTAIAFHKSALAVAFQKDVTVERSRQPEKARNFMAVRAHFGCKTLDSGKRCVLFNASGS